MAVARDVSDETGLHASFIDFTEIINLLPSCSIFNALTFVNLGLSLLYDPSLLTDMI